MNAADEDEPFLPLELILDHILPFAFSTTAEARALCLVCRSFADAVARPAFWCHFLMHERRREMEELVQAQVADLAQREGLLRCLRQRFDPREMLRAVGLAAVTVSPARCPAAGGMVMRVRQVGPGDRNCSVFCGEERKDGGRQGVGVAYFSSGNRFLGQYAHNSFDGPDNCFRWACGMSYRGAMCRNLRGGGPGRFEFVDGTVFEGVFDEDAERQCLPQRGVFTFKNYVKCPGSLQRCFAEWYAMPAEEAEFPFLKAVVEAREGRRHCFVRDKRGVLEYCDESAMVPHRRWANVFVFAKPM